LFNRAQRQKAAVRYLIQTKIPTLPNGRGSEPRTSVSGLPARLGHAWYLTAQRKLPEADPAQRKLTQEPARPSAMLAAVPQTNGELGRLSRRPGAAYFRPFLIFFCDLRSSCHR